AAAYSNIGAGVVVPLVAHIQGRVLRSVWDFGDGLMVENAPYVTHAWSGPGQYVVRLTAYNDSFPSGVSTSLLVQVVSPPVYYADAASVTPLSPYTTWATAARTIQEAVEAGVLPGRLVLVTNGTYVVGGVAVYGTMTNRVALTGAVVVQSVNGPAVTRIVG